MTVISIISLLFGTLMPALRRSRAIAKETVCQSQLRQWGIAFDTYSADNDGLFPHIDGRDRTSKISEDSSSEELADYYYGWVDVLPSALGEIPWRDHDYGKRPGKGTIFQCPSAKLVRNARYSYPPERVGFFSYSMNSCLELDEKCWPPYGYEGAGWQMPSFLKTTRIRRPVCLILLFEQLLDPKKGYDGKKLNRSAGQYCGSYPKAFSASHARPNGLLGGFILYCDYHVEWKESVWKADWPDDLEVPPRDDIDWYPYL
jgi:hypothetical protein